MFEKKSTYCSDIFKLLVSSCCTEPCSPLWASTTRKRIIYGSKYYIHFLTRLQGNCSVHNKILDNNTENARHTTQNQDARTTNDSSLRDVQYHGYDMKESFSVQKSKSIWLYRFKTHALCCNCYLSNHNFIHTTNREGRCRVHIY
jgi:hypothetical protein